jgi:hypothetical protein
MPTKTTQVMNRLLVTFLTTVSLTVGTLPELVMSSGQTAGTTPTDDVVRLGVESHANAAPSIAARGDAVVISWGAQREGRWNVYVATSRNGGASFSQPVRVNRVDGDARVNGEIAPRVALVNRSGQANPEVVVAWNARGTTTGILLATSTDFGRSFSDGEPLQTAAAEGDRGWHALAIDREGTAHTIWLDHRGLAEARRRTSASHSATDRAAMDGVAMARNSTLRYAARGRSRVEDRRVVPGVCYCCKTALVSTSKGLLAAWRHVYEGNMRDIAYAWIDRPVADPPARISRDGWSLNGCPDDGPALAVDSDDRVHAVWPTVEQGPTPRGGIFYATLDGVSGFTARVRVPTLGAPKPSHPQVATDGRNRMFVAWDEVHDGIRRAAVVSATLSPGQPPTFGAPGFITDVSMPSQYPVMATARRGLLVATVDGQAGQTVIGVRLLSAGGTARPYRR